MRNGRTRAARTVIDCARDCPFDEALTVADSALRHGHVTREELTRWAELVPSTGRRACLRVAREASGLAANPFEFHGHRAGLRRDCERYTALALRGWLVLRFSWEDVMHDPDYVAVPEDGWVSRDAREPRTVPAHRRRARPCGSAPCAG